jgi:hypothetical protein
MAKQIARLLKTDVMADIDIPAIAQFLQSQGRRGDTILAHINAKEAEMLRKMGGAEEQNPVTGLPEYFTIDDDYRYGANPYANEANIPQYQINNQRLADEDMFYSSPSSVSSDYSPTNTFNIGENLSGIYPDAPDYPVNVNAPNYQPIEQEFRADFPTQYTGQRFPLQTDITPDVLKRATTLRPEDIARGQDRIQNQIDRAVFKRNAEKEGLGDEASLIKRASAATGLSPQALARLGLAGIGTIQGIMSSREASEQGRKARRETEALARPYQQRGQQLTEQAQSGELTAAGQQQLQALRARLAQGAEGRGGVGAAQAAAQVEAFRQNLLQNQFDYGQKVSNIGDQLMLGAIRTGLEADRYAAGLSNTFFTNMASIAVGMPPSMPTQARGEQ